MVDTKRVDVTKVMNSRARQGDLGQIYWPRSWGLKGPKASLIKILYHFLDKKDSFYE